MKENCWDECVEFYSAVKVSPDKEKAKSLVSTAEERNKFLQNNKITENNASFIFEGYYSSALELIHALVTLEGYNVKNHFCLGYYLRDILKRADLFRVFENARFKRNSLVYYGKTMDFEIAKKAINECMHLIRDLKKLIEV